ncbi:SusD/RagB family nutrient-binding outer membrane lipoprotein [Arcticibacterium luteifluviistationis]|uniref:SusD/RagB family nutrient-binding outer membrane lipoprotein n=1 Tax=Arcticibacterium luteifluviistationis TaxID=1784714 RepID=A0A2Z4G780_9BACT|nr:SusD/RagB family nutrient-binding outer membrane lipoprotein [Arcticibacterium luteifluviistationis]AWV97056.1 SusD/RagB family nutrient-binding outer membrane lipoprotein [Arcticibacterium luteifluviistationis]
MKTLNIKSILTIGLMLFATFSCRDLEQLNVNPNGINPDGVVPSQMMATVLTETSMSVLNLGFQDISGVMQHTQKDAWFSGHNDYDWADQSWASYYRILRNNRHLYERAVALNLPFYEGVSVVMKSYVSGLITDLWGDAPYREAVNADNGEITPAFDSQDQIYAGILADLEKANDILIAYENGTPIENFGDDVIYNGDAAQWRRFANSLQLRYYMRISDKDPATAQAGIERLLSDPSKYPLILSSEDDATMDYVGTGSNNSWPSNSVFDSSSGSDYRRIKMCATLLEKLQNLNDPRIEVWAAKIEVPIVVDETLPAGSDEVKDGVRYISSDKFIAGQVNTDPEYVGLPPSVSALPSSYNLNPTPGQLSYNPHVSFLSEVYSKASDPLLKARLCSAAEVNFILAEAALKGWNVGQDAKTYYEEGVRQSLNNWGVADSYASYISGDAAYKTSASVDAQEEQIISQKWIASWTATTEAWFDYRRTGYPVLSAGPAAKREVLPLRFYYMQDELMLNEENATNAVNKLEETSYTQADGKNSPWAKFWVLQGTGKPW